jgi:hypothetical protein
MTGMLFRKNCAWRRNSEQYSHTGAKNVIKADFERKAVGSFCITMHLLILACQCSVNQCGHQPPTLFTLPSNSWLLSAPWSENYLQRKMVLWCEDIYRTLTFKLTVVSLDTFSNCILCLFLKMHKVCWNQGRLCWRYIKQFCFYSCMSVLVNWVPEIYDVTLYVKKVTGFYWSHFLSSFLLKFLIVGPFVFSVILYFCKYCNLCIQMLFRFPMV